MQHQAAVQFLRDTIAAQRRSLAVQIGVAVAFVLVGMAILIIAKFFPGPIQPGSSGQVVMGFAGTMLGTLPGIKVKEYTDARARLAALAALDSEMHAVRDDPAAVAVVLVRVEKLFDRSLGL